MVTIVHLKGIEEFSEYAEKVDSSEILLFYFSGEKLPGGQSWCEDCNEDAIPNKTPDHFFLFTGAKKENGRSWCVYCQLAEPVVEAFLSEVKRNIIFAYVDVGDRPTWKDKNCPFRTDKRTKLMVIPTIIRWNGVQRLEGSQCAKRDLLQMLIEDEED